MQNIYLKQAHLLLCLALAALAFSSNTAAALEIQPGAGIGLEYTDNARLTPDNTVDDIIVTTYASVGIADNKGPLTYQASTSLDHETYIKDSFNDRYNFNLNAIANWVMIQNRVNWMVSDHYTQATVIALGADTPRNREDRNVFNLAATITPNVGNRHHLSIVPSFSQYYYEKQRTDNKQYSLTTDWLYQATRLTDVGLRFGTRKINYTETSLLGHSIEDVSFSNASIVFNGVRMRSTFGARLGTTYVKRDNGQKTAGFTGHLNWLGDISSRSKFSALISTDLTDTSTIGVRIPGDFDAISGDDVQITTDVVRNSLINLAYFRKDASLDTRLSVRYHKVAYSDNPLDRIIRDFGVLLAYPVTQRLTSSVHANYNRSKQLDTGQLDKTYIVGGNLNYNFSRKLRGLLSLIYQTKDSAFAPRNYDEFSVFISLNYGFGGI